jgi:hypothetical protein
VDAARDGGDELGGVGLRAASSAEGPVTIGECGNGPVEPEIIGDVKLVGRDDAVALAFELSGLAVTASLLCAAPGGGAPPVAPAYSPSPSVSSISSDSGTIRPSFGRSHTATNVTLW